MKDVRVAPNIYRTTYGWRVYVRQHDPTTRRSVLRPVRFKAHVTLEELEYFRDHHKLETKRLRRAGRQQRAADTVARAGLVETDAETYLALKTVKAMPSYADRVRDIRLWVAAFARRPRRSITTREIDEQLQAWINEGYAASTVNNRRTALMALYSRLDGRGAANPVREARVFQEPELAPRGLPYALVVRILDAIPAERSHSHLRETTMTPIRTRARFEVMAWTGMRPSQLSQLTPEHVNFEERWFVTPRAQKGRGRASRHPRPQIRKPMTADAEAALRRFFAIGCAGPFSASSARRLFARAVQDVERAIQEERQDPTFRLPRIVPYDLRHSFGTELLRRTKSLETVAELLDHTSTRMTKRYALGAVTDVLREAATAFEAATTGGARTPAAGVQRPKAPRRRSREG